MNDPFLRFREEANQHLADVQMDERLRERILAACAVVSPSPPGVRRWVPISIVTAAAMIVLGLGMTLVNSGRLGARDVTQPDAASLSTSPAVLHEVLRRSPGADAGSAGSAAQNHSADSLSGMTEAPAEMADVPMMATETSDGTYGDSGGADQANGALSEAPAKSTTQTGGGGASVASGDPSLAHDYDEGSEDAANAIVPDAANGPMTASGAEGGKADGAAVGSTGNLSSPANKTAPRAIAGANTRLAVEAGEKGKYGYVDPTGAWVIQAAYDVAYPFDENNIAVVGQLSSDGMRYALISPTGEALTAFQYVSIDAFVQGEAAAVRADGSACRIVIEGDEVLVGETVMATATPGGDEKK